MLFIHLQEKVKKYETLNIEDGIIYNIQDEILQFNDRYDMTVRDVIKRLEVRFKNSSIYLYDEHEKRLESCNEVENATVYTLRRTSKQTSYKQTSRYR